MVILFLIVVGIVLYTLAEVAVLIVIALAISGIEFSILDAGRAARKYDNRNP